MREYLVKIWTSSAPSARARAKASWRPPEVDSWAPRSIGRGSLTGPALAGLAPARHLVPRGDEELGRVVERIVHRVHDDVPELGGVEAESLVVRLAVGRVQDARHVAGTDEHDVHQHAADLPGEVAEGEDLHEAVVRVRGLLDGVHPAELLAVHQ